MKTKSHFYEFWVGMVKKGCGLLGDRIVKSVYHKNELMNRVDFVYANTSSGNVKTTLIIFRRACSKMGVSLVSGTLKSAVSQEAIYALSSCIAC